MNNQHILNRFQRSRIVLEAKRGASWVKGFAKWVLRHAKWGLLIPWLLGALYLLYELQNLFSVPSQDMFGNVRSVLITLAAWVGVPFLIWRTWLADKQTNINREIHYTDLFTKAVESLGATRLDPHGMSAPIVEARIGAIFALERLAKNSHSDYGIIVETLSAYIREQCGQPSKFDYNGDDPDEEGISISDKESRLRRRCQALLEWTNELKTNPPANRQDVAVALKVLSRRAEGRHWSTNSGAEVQPYLNGANLQGASIGDATEGLIHGETGIAYAFLEGASFSGFYFEESSVVGPQVRHEPAVSRVVAKSLVGTSLFGLTLRNAQFFPILDGADLSFAHMDGASCEHGSFRNARMVRADFRNAKLNHAKLAFAGPIDANFDGADLRYAELIGTVATDTNFVGADLSYAMFHKARLKGTNFEGALLVGTDLSEAYELEIGMIEGAFGSESTLLPRGLDRPADWAGEDSAVAKWNQFNADRGLR